MKERMNEKQTQRARIRGPPVTDRWAGVVQRENVYISKNLPTGRTTDRPADTASSRVACLRLESDEVTNGKALMFDFTNDYANAVHDFLIFSTPFLVET